VKPHDDHYLPLQHKLTLSFDMSWYEYIEIFNKLKSVTSYGFNRVDKKALNCFKNPYMFKRGNALSTLDIFKPKENIKYSGLILMNSNNKYLRVNPSQDGVFHMKQTIDLKILQPTMGIRRRASLITHGSRH